MTQDIGTHIELPAQDKMQALIESLVSELGSIEFNYREQKRAYLSRRDELVGQIRTLVRSSQK